MADAGRGDWLLCQITSKPYADDQAVELTQSDFATGGLQRISYARAAKLFTAHASLISSTVGEVHTSTQQRVCDTLVALLQRDTPRP